LNEFTFGPQIQSSTSSLAIAERPRCRVDHGQKWKTGSGRQYLRTL